VKHALRGFARSPRFAAVAVATLAIGIGANTATFSVVNALLLKPLPFAEPDRLMLVHLLRPDRNAGPGAFRESVWSYPRYRMFADRQQAFEDYALFSSREFNLADEEAPQRVGGEVVTDRYPAVLGAEPILGRAFTYAEANQAGAPAVALIGHRLWTNRYGADPAIVGRTIRLNATPYTIIGVLPPGFTGLSGNAQLWATIAAVDPGALEEPFSHSYLMVARRKPGVTEAAAIASTRLTRDLVGAELLGGDAAGSPAPPNSATAVSLSASRADADVRRATLVLLGAVGFVLLIACVNLTNLLVARALERRREVAVRMALGASRARIGRQFLVESLLLAGTGGLVALALAPLLLTAAAALLPESNVFFRSELLGGTRIEGAAGLTRVGADSIGLDAATLVFTLALTAVTAALVALVPALQVSSLRPVDALKSAGGAVGARGRRELAVRSAPVVAQIALALALLAGAGLMVRSAVALYGTPIGIDPAGLLTVRLDLPGAMYGASERGTAFYTELADRVRALPGVESVGFASFVPVGGGYNQTRAEFLRPQRDGNVIVGIHWTTPDYFSTVGIPVLQGRSFDDGDRAGAPKVVLINEAAARAYWPNESPLGKTIGVWQGGFDDGAQIVGVIANVRYRGIETAALPDVYLPHAQSYRGRMELFVRSGLPPQSLAAAIAREVRALDPSLPLADVKTMTERVGDAMWRTRVGAWLMSAFAVLALLLTAIGIFGVMAQAVARRTAEIGIRMALGAEPRDVLRWILRRGALVTGAGLGLGVVLALGLARVLGALLYGVSADDPLTFVAVTVVLGLVALAACYLPARRATRVDVVEALKTE
jgi:predicted permease